MPREVSKFPRNFRERGGKQVSQKFLDIRPRKVSKFLGGGKQVS